MRRGRARTAWIGCALAGVQLSGLACAQRETFVLRGELDRRSWWVRPCDAGRAHRLVLTSSQAYDLHQRELELGAEDPDVPLLLEFEAVALRSGWPWQPDETVGARGPLSLQRGDCAQAGRTGPQPSSR